MGCVECKYCKQEEDNNQFEYPNIKKKENNDNNGIKNNSKGINNSTNSNKSNQFLKEFDEKIKFIGTPVTKEEFLVMLPDQVNTTIQSEPLQYNKDKNSHNMKPIEFTNGNIYHGQWNKNFEMDGYGKYYLKDERILAEGLWDKGELKFARIFYPNGDIYEGEMLDSFYNGKGKLILQNKDTYIGQFEKGEKNGEGKMIFNDGTEYNGNFINNTFNGNGNMKWQNGIEYKGNFSENFLEGEGVLIDNNNGEKYEGNFSKNLFHGKGKYTYTNGDEYDGDFEYGIRKGKGTYKKKDGFLFEGLWDNNIPNGFGKIAYNDNALRCNFHNGNLIYKSINKNAESLDDIDYNFFNQPMNLSTIKFSHLENNEVSSSQYKPEAKLSFLED